MRAPRIMTTATVLPANLVLVLTAAHGFGVFYVCASLAWHVSVLVGRIHFVGLVVADLLVAAAFSPGGVGVVASHHAALTDCPHTCHDLFFPHRFV